MGEKKKNENYTTESVGGRTRSVGNDQASVKPDNKPSKSNLDDYTPPARKKSE